jgi:hypothetical protein
LKENPMLAVTANRREELAAMVLELQANRTVLNGLADWFGVFAFTGGRVPTAQWSLAGATAYLLHPSAADGPSTAELERYRCLVRTISDLDQIAAGPRTLKCRRMLGDRFDLAASDLRLVTNELELSMTKAIEAL